MAGSFAPLAIRLVAVFQAGASLSGNLRYVFLGGGILNALFEYALDRPAAPPAVSGAPAHLVLRWAPNDVTRRPVAHATLALSDGGHHGGMVMEVNGIEGLRELVGTHLGYSDWMEITQERVNQFADATGDHQWIHVDVERAKKESPFGGPIAHGYLTMSLAPVLFPQIMRVTG